MPAEIGITSTAMESSAQRSERANVPGASTWRVRSGWMAVWIGWASTAYGARKNVNDTWYATVPPSTRLPITMAASRSAPTMEFWNTAHPDSFRSPLTAASGRLRRGTRRNPPRQSATVGDADEGGHPQGPSEGEDQLLPDRQREPGVGSGDHPERPHRHHHDDGQPDRCDAGDREPPLRVERGDGDGADRVQHDLRDEEVEQEGREAALLFRDVRVLDARGEQARDERRRRHPDRGDDGERDHRDAQQPPGQLLGAALVAPVEKADERRDEHGGQRTRGEELEQHVRDRVRRRVGVAEVGRAEDRGDDEDAGEPERPRHRRGDPHAGRGPADRGRFVHPRPLTPASALTAPTTRGCCDRRPLRSRSRP